MPFALGGAALLDEYVPFMVAGDSDSSGTGRFDIGRGSMADIWVPLPEKDRLT